MAEPRLPPQLTSSTPGAGPPSRCSTRSSSAKPPRPPAAGSPRCWSAARRARCPPSHGDPAPPRPPAPALCALPPPRRVPALAGSQRSPAGSLRAGEVQSGFVPQNRHFLGCFWSHPWMQGDAVALCTPLCLSLLAGHGSHRRGPPLDPAPPAVGPRSEHPPRPAWPPAHGAVRGSPRCHLGASRGPPVLQQHRAGAGPPVPRVGHRRLQKPPSKGGARSWGLPGCSKQGSLLPPCPVPTAPSRSGLPPRTVMPGGHHRAGKAPGKGTGQPLDVAIQHHPKIL